VLHPLNAAGDPILLLPRQPHMIFPMVWVKHYLILGRARIQAADISSYMAQWGSAIAISRRRLTTYDMLGPIHLLFDFTKEYAS
jgi:hypothetical protein